MLDEDEGDAVSRLALGLATSAGVERGVVHGPERLDEVGAAEGREHVDVGVGREAYARIGRRGDRERSQVELVQSLVAVHPHRRSTEVEPVEDRGDLLGGPRTARPLERAARAARAAVSSGACRSITPAVLTDATPTTLPVSRAIA